MKRYFLQYALAWMLVCTALGRMASAHAFLDRAEPRVGSTVTTAPTQIKIWFTQELEPDFSKIEVVDAQGNVVDKGDTHLDEKDKQCLIVSVEALAAGTYKVVWHVVSTDTHRTQGDFKFVVAGRASGASERISGRQDRAGE